MKGIFFGSLVSILLGVSATEVAFAQGAADYPAAWPRPGATLLIENDRGAAYDVVYPVNEPTSMHRHRYGFAGLDLNTATLKVTQPDGTSSLTPVIKNQMWFLPKGLTHQEMYITEPGGHAIVIDIKEKRLSPVGNSTNLPTDKFAKDQIKVLDNDVAVIWDCAWASGAEGIRSFNSRDMFLAFAEGGDLSIATQGQDTTVKHYDAGQAIFLPAGHARTIASIKGTVHVMLVQVK